MNEEPRARSTEEETPGDTPEERSSSGSAGEEGEGRVGGERAPKAEDTGGRSAEAGEPPVDADEWGEPSEEISTEEREWTEKVEELVNELERLNDRHLRLAAEFENYRRRAQSELEEASARAQAALVGQLLDAVDDLERVGRVDPDATDVDDLLDGIGLVTRKLNRILEDAGVEMLDPQGEAFTPETMEAVMKVPAGSPDEDDVVHQVFQRGCLFKGRLVRPARVSVQKHE